MCMKCQKDYCKKCLDKWREKMKNVQMDAIPLIIKIVYQKKTFYQNYNLIASNVVKLSFKMMHKITMILVKEKRHHIKRR